MSKYQKVKVLQADENGVWSVIKRGFILNQTQTSAQVFEPPDPENNTGDPQPDFCEWFAFSAPRTKIVAV